MVESEKKQNSQKALLVIDIQEDYTGVMAKPPFPYKDSERLIKTINGLIQKAALQHFIIAYIRQEFDSPEGIEFSKKFCGGTAIKGRPGTEFDKRLNILSQHCFAKSMPDAFSNPKFKTFLDEQNIRELYLVGLDAAYCVYETAKSAIIQGYKAFVVTDAIALQKEIEWDNLLKQYVQDGIILIKTLDLE